MARLLSMFGSVTTDSQFPKPPPANEIPLTSINWNSSNKSNVLLKLKFLKKENFHMFFDKKSNFYL